MVIYVVDGEKHVLNHEIKAIAEAAPEARILSFTKEQDVLSAVDQIPPDVVFLDIMLWGRSGIELAKKLKGTVPGVNIIFSTGCREYAGDAFAIHASGYLMKPITPEKVREELENLRFRTPQPKREGLVFRAFGEFAVFWNGEPVQFRYNKTLELLAYLVDRKGALCSVQQIIDALWENASGQEKRSYYQNLRKDLLDTLQKLGRSDILIVQRAKLGIRLENVRCDYYDWLAGRSEGVRAFHGEYMTQYSWSEYTLGRLELESETQNRS